MLLITATAWIVTKPAFGFFQPEYQNRGLTAFLDAYVAPGFYVQYYFSSFKANKLRVGDKNAPGRFKLSVNTSLYQFAYVSQKKVLGGYLGGEIIFPVANGHLTMNGTRDNDHGLGDIFIAGFIQTDKKTLRLGTYEIPTYWRFLAGVNPPTGSYHHDKSLNVGCNIYNFQLYTSSTFFFTPKWEVSSRFMYNFHTTNNEYGPNKDTLRPGQLFSVNFATSYLIKEHFRLGANGYYWQQTTDDTLNGNHLNGKERALAFGPGIIIDKAFGDTKCILISHALFDTAVKNRSQGTTLQTRLIIAF